MPNATAEDLIKKLPGMEVDKEGNVKSQGEQVQKVYVDGKEFFGNDPKLATKNITADMIESVQVFDDMSDQAKFTKIDDGSRSKTLNIKLKKDRNKGYFGRALLGIGDNGKYETNLTLNKFNGNQRVSLLFNTNNINKQGFSFSDIISSMGGFSGFGSGGGFAGFDGGSDQGEEPWIGWPSSGAGDGCFAPETRVLMADGTFKPIYSISPNDMVRSGEGAGNISVVKGVYALDSTVVHKLELAGPGSQAWPVLMATEEHLVWVDGEGWTAVGKLKSGDWLLNSKGVRVRVTGNELMPDKMRVYTLKLAGDVAFYADDVLVHDLCGAPPSVNLVKTVEVAR